MWKYKKKLIRKKNSHRGRWLTIIIYILHTLTAINIGHTIFIYALANAQQQRDVH